MKIVKNIFKNFLRKKKNWSNTGKESTSKNDGNPEVSCVFLNFIYSQNKL